jgi:uncharacterized protein YdeI (YjbR/CyaY-like superfamily)
MPRFTATLEVRGAGRLVEVPLDVRREVRAAAGVEVGDVLTIDLERDEDERTVVVPRDLEAALDPATRATFADLSFTHRREYVRWIEEAKREDTRRRRVAKAIEMLRTGVKTPG